MIIENVIILPTQLSEAIVFGEEIILQNYTIYQLDWWSFSEQEQMNLLHLFFDEEDIFIKHWYNMKLIFDKKINQMYITIIQPEYLFCFCDCNEEELNEVIEQCLIKLKIQTAKDFKEIA